MPILIDDLVDNLRKWQILGILVGVNHLQIALKLNEVLYILLRLLLQCPSSQLLLLQIMILLLLLDNRQSLLIHAVFAFRVSLSTLSGLHR